MGLGEDRGVRDSFSEEMVCRLPCRVADEGVVVSRLEVKNSLKPTTAPNKSPQNLPDGGLLAGRTASEASPGLQPLPSPDGERRCFAK